MTAGHLSGAGQGVGDLAPDQRHLGRRLVIGLGGEEADEPGLSGGPAVGAEPLDPDIVHIGAAMDAGADIGLGHGHRLGQVQLLLHGFGQHGRLIGAAQHGSLGIGQNPQTDPRLRQGRLSLIAAVLAARVVVVPGPEKDEMVVLKPFQEVDMLRQDIGRDPVRIGLKMGDRPMHQRRHAGVAFHRTGHVLQGQGHAFAQGVAPFLRQGIHDHDDGGLAPAVFCGHRMVHGPDRYAGVGQLAHDAVDEKRPVVLDDDQNIITQRNAVHAVKRRQGDARGFAVGPALGPAPGHGEQAGHVAPAQVGRLVGGIVFPGLTQEVLARAGQCAGGQLVEAGFQRLQGDGLRVRGGRFAGHGQVSCGRDLSNRSPEIGGRLGRFAASARGLSRPR